MSDSLPVFRATGQTDRGQARQRNEDSYVIDIERGLFLVSDGMGGHAAGELASQIVADVLPTLLYERMQYVQDFADPASLQEILDCISTLSDHVRTESRKHPRFFGMGATVALALIREAGALIAHLGDSRVYLLRQRELKLLTRDHAIIQILLENGEITPEQAKTHPARSQITRYVGMEGEVLPEGQLIILEPGDRLLLCTDGVTNMISEQTITELLLAHPDPQNACHALIQAANAAGGHDNITVIVVNWE